VRARREGEGWGGEGERVRGGLLCSAEKRGIKKRAKWAAGGRDERAAASHTSLVVPRSVRETGVTVE
jgi:hypothetical protein